MKTLIISYSLDGNTKYVSQNLKEILDADVLELKTKKELVNKNSFTKYLWGGKMVFMKEKVEIEEFDIDFSKYELIIIGTPVWAFTYTPPLRTFFLQKLLLNKKIALFCCHGGGPGKTLQNMENELIGNEIISKNDFLEPLTRKIEENKQKIITWGNELKDL